MDDIPREIQILNQIVNDPTINGVIMTTPQVGAYNDIVKKLEERGVVVATTNSFDGTLYDRSNISHTGQDASAAAIGGEAIVKCLIKNNVKGGSILFPNTVSVGNIEVNNRVTAAFQATLEGPQGRQPPAGLQGRRRPQQYRRRRRPTSPPPRSCS